MEPAGGGRIDVVVLGGGIAGLAAAYRLQRGVTSGTPTRCWLIEGTERLGGKIVTDREGGFVLEGGPDAFVARKPRALELVRELGLEERLLPSNDARRGISILHRRRLVPVPAGMSLLVPGRWGPLLRSPLLSWRGKLRMALEGRVPARRDGADESVADFVRRRLGSEVLERLGEPLLAHLHVADVERMSVAATYPQLVEVERRWGSLSRGARAARPSSAGSSGPQFWSLRGGLGELSEALADRLDPSSLVLGRRAVSLRRASGAERATYAVRLDDGREVEAAAVVLAIPAPVAAGLVADLDRRLAGRLRSIPYVSLATLSLGYRRADLDRPLDGFGFLVPRRELRTILACTWTSNKFDRRAAEDDVLVRVFLGGALGEEVLALEDGELSRAVEKELQEILGFRAEPVLRRIYRWPEGYPQYEVGHLDRVRAIEAALPPGVFLAGSAYRGIGLSDCIESGFEAAGRVASHLDLEE